ncbi:hypothetical protein PV327_006534 [Microctonus hyperodae]|uniref:Uncharacterized protein n=1 Tax=Microctonus hyperodae TaxID=165561 RepID=A0AA39KID3_MICHY|nr:hypothetical protein PV327_006534 [Microctonus hyperodae]
MFSASQQPIQSSQQQQQQHHYHHHHHQYHHQQQQQQQHQNAIQQHLKQIEPAAAGALALHAHTFNKHDLNFKRQGKGQRLIVLDEDGVLGVYSEKLSVASSSDLQKTEFRMIPVLIVMDSQPPCNDCHMNWRWGTNRWTTPEVSLLPSTSIVSRYSVTMKTKEQFKGTNSILLK